MSSPARTLERAALALLLAGAFAARAATVCTGNNTSIDLGTYYGDTSAPVDSIGSFVLTCTRRGGPQGVTVTLGIGPSASGGSIASRKLQSASWPDTLGYNIYRDAMHQSVWGQTAGVDTVSQSVNIPNNSSRSLVFTLYGRINGSQDVRTGGYADLLSLTVDY